MNAPPRLFLSLKHNHHDVISIPALSVMTGVPTATLQRLFSRYAQKGPLLSGAPSASQLFWRSRVPLVTVTAAPSKTF